MSLFTAKFEEICADNLKRREKMRAEMVRDRERRRCPKCDEANALQVWPEGNSRTTYCRFCDFATPGNLLKGP